MLTPEHPDVINLGYEIYGRIVDDLLPEHEGERVYIDCQTGGYIVQGHRETLYDAEMRFREEYPNGEMFAERIMSDDYTIQLPSITVA